MHLLENSVTYFVAVEFISPGLKGVKMSDTEGGGNVWKEIQFAGANLYVTPNRENLNKIFKSADIKGDRLVDCWWHPFNGFQHVP